jgi:hypothetical protein
VSQEPIPIGARELQYRAAELGAELEAARWLEARARGRVPEGQDNRLTAAIRALRNADRKLRDARARAA